METATPLVDALRLAHLAWPRRAGRWREQNPQGTDEQLVADLGSQFHRDYGVVLRAVLFAVDSHRAKITTGVSMASTL